MFGQSAGTFPASRSPSSDLEKLPTGPIFENSRRNVPITASGPQGEQPLLDMENAGKGSRQIRPVTLGKGLALVLRGIYPWVADVAIPSLLTSLLCPSGCERDAGEDGVSTSGLGELTVCSKLELQRSKVIRLFN